MSALRVRLLQMAAACDEMKAETLRLAAEVEEPDELLPVPAAAAVLGIKPGTLYKAHGAYPGMVRHGRKILYSRAALKEWLREQGGNGK